MNKLLEAILKGILMGLEIQDDELDLITFQGSLITSDYHTGRADLLRWLRDNFVDLGLPSGILWCKWNLGATNGNTVESWYGNYYAWGEVEIKKQFLWRTYKHCKVKLHDVKSLTKYDCKDSKSTLDLEDDAVSVTLGTEFRMPTKEDIEELCSLPSKWVRNYDGIYGLNGRVFTGTNGKQLFIPAAGYYSGFDFYDRGSYCNIWSSSLHTADPLRACDLCFCSDDVFPYNYDNRCYGISIRGIL